MSPDLQTNQSLILRAKNRNDPSAWKEFVSYYELFIFRVLHRMQVPSNDFDDLVQNTLLKLWQNLASYDSTKASFRTWLGVVVKNVVLDQFTLAKRQRKLASHEVEFMELVEGTKASDIEQMIEQEWAVHVTNLAMQRINELFSEQAVQSFTMSLAGHSAAVIAEKLNISVESAYTLKSRVRARLIKEVKAVIRELEG